MGARALKRVLEAGEPIELEDYRSANPLATWDEMRDDGEVYKTVRATLVNSQGGLCAYCELGVDPNDPLKSRVEHFHPKGDQTGSHNWALDWSNMIAVCHGGSQRALGAPYTLEPLSDNLSCDAYRDKMIQSGELQEKCEGWLLNPKSVPVSPCLLFLEKSTGKLIPDEQSCENVMQAENQHEDVKSLVQNTIDMLNLNCDRLCMSRRQVIWDIENKKKKKRNNGYTAQQGLLEIAEFYFRTNWPQFFTTVRLSLGPEAEKYLLDINFQG